MLEVAIGNSNSSRVLGNINQSIISPGKVTMINPDIPGVFDMNSISFELMLNSYNIMHIDPMHNHIRRFLDRNLGGAHKVHLGTASINRLEARHLQFPLELDCHGADECDPERFGSGHSVAEGAGSGVLSVVVGGSYDVLLAVFAADGVAAESDCAGGELLATGVPVGVATPAVVDVVACSAVACCAIGGF